jgi:hypothetical protein
MLYKTLALNVALVSGWATCQFPKVDWFVVDQGTGKSATQKVAGMGSDVFISGYAANTTTLTSTSSATTLTSTSESMSNSAPDLHISKIGADGTPLLTKIFKCVECGSTPSFAVIHAAESGQLAAVGSTPGDLTLGTASEVVSGLTAGSNVGYIALFDTNIKLIWYKTIESSGGVSITGADGDAQGSVYATYKTCIPCTDPETCVAEMSYGRPTGRLEPTCSQHLGKFANGNAVWSVDLPATVTLGYLRVGRTGTSDAATDIYTTFKNDSPSTVSGISVTQGGGVMKFNAADGSLVWFAHPADGVSASYIDVSPSATDPFIAISGSLYGSKTMGPNTVVGNLGAMSSYIARMSTTDGSIVWAEAVPMSRGVQITPDNQYVGVFSQTTGDTDVVALTDTGGVTTTMRSRGSWDLIAIKLDAATGDGVYAIDGGGDGMEYFHGFGMTSNGDLLISGYSRSNSFHFGTHTLPNAQSRSHGGDGQNKVYTIQVSADSYTPTCVDSCASNTPVVKSGHCFIDHYCYADGAYSTYPANACFKCDVSASQSAWTGPDVTAGDGYCFINDVCIPNGSAKPGATSRSAPSACQTCDVTKSTDDWTTTHGWDLVDGKCVELTTITTTASTALTTAMAASTLVSAVTSPASSGDFAAAKTAYVGSTLQTLAKTAFTGCPDYDMAAAYYGSATYLDDYMLSALDGTGQFSGTLSPTTRGDMADARTEAVKKCAQDQILVNAAIGTLQLAHTSASAWYKFYAYWTGDTPAGAPWARANKRCQNYGTCGGGTSGENGEIAIINSNILLAVLGALADPTNNGASHAKKAADNALMVYFQAALRYAYKVDAAMALDPPGATADYQGEGGAFWRVIAPYLPTSEAAAVEVTMQFYTMTNAPTGTDHYCPLKRLLHANLPSGLGASDMGSLGAASAVTCKAVPTAGAAGVQDVVSAYTITGVTVADVTAENIVDMSIAFANQAGVDPSQVTVTVMSGSVILQVVIKVFDADAAAVVATLPTDPAGLTAVMATADLTLDPKTVTVTTTPVAQAPGAVVKPDSDGDDGLSTGALIGIIAGVVVLVVVIVVVVMMKKKAAGRVKVVNAA